MSEHTVYINGRFVTQRVTGVQRYAHEALAALDTLLAERARPAPSFVLLVPRGSLAPSYRQLEIRQVGRLSGHAWEQLELPYHARGGPLLGFAATGPLAKRDQLITVHDAAVVRAPAAYSRRFRLWYRVVTRTVSTRAPRVFSVSNFSAREASACFGCDPARIVVTGAGFQHLLRATADARLLERHGLTPSGYVLAVSSPTPNKNFSAVLRAAELLSERSLRFAIAGSADPAVFADTLLRGSPRVSMLGYVSDGELRALYQNALCFVFPSLYEGFGLPALEAMSEGCPVLASDIPALREVCQESALYFDPHNPAQLAALVQRLSSTPALAAGLSRAGRARAGTFSWRHSAERILATVTALLPADGAHDASAPSRSAVPTRAPRARAF